MKSSILLLLFFSFLLSTCLLLSTSAAIITAEEAEEDTAGEGEEGEEYSRGFQATFENHYLNEPISLYWQNAEVGGRQAYLGDIEIDGSISVNTFDGHMFLARGTQSRKLANPPLV